MNAKTLCIRSAVSTTILMLSCRGRDRDSLLRLVREADHGWMALAAAWVAASMGISTGKWRRLLRAQEISVSWGTLWRSYWMGLFFNNFLPSSVGFDAIRVLTLRDEGRTPGILLSVVVERLLALAGLALVGAIAVACGRASVGVGIPESLADSSDFLREGILSGCCCCALTGTMMICGVSVRTLSARNFRKRCTTPSGSVSERRAAGSFAHGARCCSGSDGTPAAT